MWINGPFKAGKNDIGIFRSEQGLESKIPENKYALGDSAYKSSNKATFKKKIDSKELRDFKNRALARHETFNGRIKNFGSLANRWRHCIKKHKSVMEAVVFWFNMIWKTVIRCLKFIRLTIHSC